MSRHFGEWDEPDTDPDAPDPEQQARIDEFYENIFWTPETTPPEHHEEKP